VVTGRRRARDASAASSTDTPGYDLRGASWSAKGCSASPPGSLVRLTPNPPDVRTMLLPFADVERRAATVGAIIADGMVPAAIEMMDHNS
jgi:glycolate oxidase